MRSGGGLSTLLYSLRKARESGGLLKFYRRMRLRNTCKTCAVGMGGIEVVAMVVGISDSVLHWAARLALIAFAAGAAALLRYRGT